MTPSRPATEAANGSVERLRQMPRFCRSSAWPGALDRASFMLLRLNSVQLDKTLHRQNVWGAGHCSF